MEHWAEQLCLHGTLLLGEVDTRLGRDTGKMTFEMIHPVGAKVPL